MFNQVVSVYKENSKVGRRLWLIKQLLFDMWPMHFKLYKIVGFTKLSKQEPCKPSPPPDTAALKPISSCHTVL